MNLDKDNTLGIRLSNFCPLRSSVSYCLSITVPTWLIMISKIAISKCSVA